MSSQRTPKVQRTQSVVTLTAERDKKKGADKRKREEITQNWVAEKASPQELLLAILEGVQVLEEKLEDLSGVTDE